MLRAIRFLTLVLGSLLLAEGLPQTERGGPATFGLDRGEYSVGFRLLEGRDPSRAVTGGLPGTVHSRPIRTYLWYPAERDVGAEPMRFGRYVALADDDIWPAEIAGDVREALTYSRSSPLARSLGAARLEALSQRLVLASENAEPLQGPFPLIVIGPGLYYESPIAYAALAEYLAGRGFVVAAAPLAGTDTALVRVETVDLETQVRDLEVVIARARQLEFVSTERLGVFGFDMGGMSGLILAMRNPDVDAFVSADAGILYPHPSGLPRSSAHYDPSALRIPWLHVAQPAVAMPPPGFEGQSLLDEARHSERYLLIAETMGHVDFTGYALIEDRAPVLGTWGPGTAEAAAAHRVFAEYVHGFFAAYLSESVESAAFLARDPAESFPGASLTLERRGAIPAPIGYAELVQRVAAGRADEAVDALRALAAVEPEHRLLSESALWRLGLNLLFTWELVEEAKALLELTVELHPAFGEAQALLAEAYIALEDYPAAVDLYGGYLEQFPDDARARSRLEWLRSR